MRIGNSPRGEDRNNLPEGETDIRVLLFVEKGAAREKYLQALASCGARVFISPSFFALSEENCRQTYHGLFLDLPTKMKAIRENKAFVYRVAERFPVAHLQIDWKSGELRCFYCNQKIGCTVVDFITSQCRAFTPQKIRMNVRRAINLPVLIYKHQGDKRPERSITSDLSPGGCFVFSCRRWREGQDILIRFKNISDPWPLPGHIKTVVKWGKNRQIPGIGIQFKDVSPSQAAELAECLTTPPSHDQ